MQTATSLTLPMSWPGILNLDYMALHSCTVLMTLLSFALVRIHDTESIFGAALALMFWAIAMI